MKESINVFIDRMKKMDEYKIEEAKSLDDLAYIVLYNPEQKYDLEYDFSTTFHEEMIKDLILFMSNSVIVKQCIIEYINPRISREVFEYDKYSGTYKINQDSLIIPDSLKLKKIINLQIGIIRLELSCSIKECAEDIRDKVEIIDYSNNNTVLYYDNTLVYIIRGNNKNTINCYLSNKLYISTELLNYINYYVDKKESLFIIHNCKFEFFNLYTKIATKLSDLYIIPNKWWLPYLFKYSKAEVEVTTIITLTTLLFKYVSIKIGMYDHLGFIYVCDFENDEYGDKKMQKIFIPL